MITNSIQAKDPLPPALVNDAADWPRLLWVVPIAVAAAALANVIFYFILTNWLGEPMLMPSESPLTTMAPMPVWEVVVVSIIFSLSASFVYVLLTAATKRPDRNFIVISAVVLFASFVPLLGVPNSPVALSARLGLVSMHIIGAIVVVGLLVGLGKSRG